jgi:DNA-binding transcriptional ArsR family regulator
MEILSATAALAALAQPTRLLAFKRLVKAELAGLSAGEIARDLAIPANTMSAHLAILARAGLVMCQRRSRLIIYRADLDRLRAIMLVLPQDCCGGTRRCASRLLPN